ncbi:MAG: hypothetical protein QHC77_12190 [Stenotrophomonas sp.]|uniref:hypothetical protein n=1 Tax=Stenotrophomonas sp. TaxID=69392 RepID=UPI0029BBF9EE|nr:hypothetical protein [Stenotrophomonas sp.]MDX3932683.1 hypothetical protein [Stenotrophomonas sp.]
MRSTTHIHTPDDGRGRRLVTVDGKVVEKVRYADTRKGIVRHYDTPLRIHKHGKRAIERTKHGTVRVEFL